MVPEPLPALVIFDFDGVLADSEVIALEELAAEMTRRGAEITTAEAQVRFLGCTTRDHMDFIRARTGDPAEDFPRVWHQRLYRRYASELVPVPGTVETLDLLDQLDIAYCIGTGGAVERLGHALDAIGLTARFQGRGFSAEMVARGKPAPDLFLHAAARMGVTPSRTLVVEDSTAGIEAAKSAGMQAVGFTGGSHLRDQQSSHAARLAAMGASFCYNSHAALQSHFMERAA